MWGIYTMTFFTMLVTASMGQFLVKQDNVNVKRGTALAQQLFAYKYELSKYLTANPSFTGMVPDNYLNKNGFLSSLCSGQMCWGNVVTSSSAYVFQKGGVSIPYPVDIEQVYELSKRSPLVGTKDSAGYFSSYAKGQQASFGALPAVIPTGVVVIKLR